MNLLDAAYHVVHDYPGGAGSLAPRLQKSPTTLSHEVHGTGTAKLGLLDAEKITALTGSLGILQAFATNAGQMLVPLPVAMNLTSGDCLLRLAATAQAFGELCREVPNSLADGSVSDNDMERIDLDCGQLIASLYSLREALAAQNRLTQRGSN